jgi:hypothetical protein
MQSKWKIQGKKGKNLYTLLIKVYLYWAYFHDTHNLRKRFLSLSLERGLCKWDEKSRKFGYV